MQDAPEPSYDVENAVFQWEEGYRRLQEARSEPPLYRALARTVLAVQDELQKRLGSSFSVSELAGLYRREGTDWTLDLAMRARPEDLTRWNPSFAADAAFYLYMRRAADFAGGRARY